VEACEEKPSGGPSLEVEHDTIEQFVALNIRQDPDLEHAVEVPDEEAMQAIRRGQQGRRRTSTAYDAIHSTTS